MNLIADYNYNYNNYYDSQLKFTNATGYSAFSQQPNLLADSPDAFRIRVPITPWGFRKSTATAYDSNLRGLELKLSYQPDGVPPEQMSNSPGSFMSVSGQWSMEASNLLPFDLTECRLMLSTCRAEVTTDSQYRGMYGVQPIATTLTVRIVPGNANIILENLPASASKTSAVEGVTFHDTQTQTQGYGIHNASVVPRAAYNGATAAWFVARISRSPLLSIDDKESDFEPLEESHYFVQEIYPEQLPTEWTKRHEAWLDLQLKSANEQLLQNNQGADF